FVPLLLRIGRANAQQVAGVLLNVFVSMLSDDEWSNELMHIAIMETLQSFINIGYYFPVVHQELVIPWDPRADLREWIILLIRLAQNAYTGALFDRDETWNLI